MYTKKKNNYLNISERKVLLRIFDVLCLLIGDYIISSFLDFTYIPLGNSMKLMWITTFLFYFMFFGNIFELYDLKVSSSRYVVFKSILITCSTTVLFYVFTPVLTPSLPDNRVDILYLFLGMVIPLTCWRLIYSTFIFSPKFLKNILIIGSSEKVESLLLVSNKQKSQSNIISYISEKEINNYPKLKFINLKEANLISIIKEDNIDEIVVSTSSLSIKSDSPINKQLVYLFEHGVNIKSIENSYEEITESVAKENLNKEFYKHISFSDNHENSLYLLFRRIIDILISVIGISSLLLYIPFVFLGNLFGSRGPLFYKQLRVGEKGKNFYIYKFRSMVVNAEKEGKAVWASKNDVRITAFGKFIRKTRIDETPQFWNILIGEMSLIGPRPERPIFVEDLKKELPFYAIRHVIKPGLTGWAQVMYPYACTTKEQEIKLRYDLYYIKSRSMFMDFKILIKTISTVVQMKGQ
jgi:exopolysaccharide biosynthesis polyprenyl glycosylphosphotransferase